MIIPSEVGSITEIDYPRKGNKFNLRFLSRLTQMIQARV